MALFGKMARRPAADLLLAGEALALLAVFRIALAMVPVRRIIGSVTRGRAGDVTGNAAMQTSQTRLTALRVQWAVSAAARHSLVEFVCFPQALAGYTMLRRRGMPSTLVYGVTKSAEGDLIAHTWLTVGDDIVLGGDAANGFTPIERWT
jgi:hypothetical protein